MRLQQRRQQSSQLAFMDPSRFTAIQDASVVSVHNHIRNIVREGLAARDHSSDGDVAIVVGGLADAASEGTLHL